ncbi:MAG: hypothetical protein QW063_01705 [Candidatus Nanoarchaeia archaeon]
MLTQIEALQSHLKKLNNRAFRINAVVVVEGKKDVKALKPILGASFFILNNGTKRSLYESAEVLASRYKSAILLLDTDKKGKELRKKMKSYLQLFGTKVYEERKLLKLARARTVEDLSSINLVRFL